MATIVFDNFRNAQLGDPAGTTTQIDFPTDDIRFTLLEGSGGDGVTHLVTHSSFDDVDGTGSNAVPTGGDSGALGGKTVGSPNGVGVFDCTSPITFTGVTGASDVDYLTLRKYDATPANSTLVLSYESVSTTGLPLTPNGGDVTVTLNASGILQI